MTTIDKFQGETRWLSNFEYAPIVYEGIEYPTNEHAFQAAKSLDINIRKEFAALPTPREAKKKGRQIALRSDWEEIKIQVMYDINWLKFYNHGRLARQLVDTGDIELIEGNTWGDTFWGICNGQGRNELGKILMEIRNIIKNLKE